MCQGGFRTKHCRLQTKQGSEYALRKWRGPIGSRTRDRVLRPVDTQLTVLEYGLICHMLLTVGKVLMRNRIHKPENLAERTSENTYRKVVYKSRGLCAVFFQLFGATFIQEQLICNVLSLQNRWNQSGTMWHVLRKSLFIYLFTFLVYIG